MINSSQKLRIMSNIMKHCETGWDKKAITLHGKEMYEILMNDVKLN